MILMNNGLNKKGLGAVLKQQIHTLSDLHISDILPLIHGDQPFPVSPPTAVHAFNLI